MNICKEFHYAVSVVDALQALEQASGSSRIIAGGTDMLLDLQQGRHDPVHTLVDITNIPELNLLEFRDDEIFIGSAVPHRAITTSPDIKEHAQVLAEASGLIGGPQVRNVATLGGNVAHALPAADGTIALMVTETTVEIASLTERRLAPLAELFKGPGQSTLDPCKEILVGFHLPYKKTGRGSSFKRVMRPQGVAIAILNCATWLHRDGDTIVDVRLSIGPSGPTPKRLTEVENALKGKPFSEAELESAYAILLDSVSFRTSRHRATKEYREEMAGVLFRDTMHTAWQRALA